MTTTTFPLLKTKANVVFLDDDERFLDVLCSLIPAEFGKSVTCHPADLDARLHSMDSDIAKERRLLSALLSAPGNSPIARAFEYFSWDTRRQIPSVFVCDHAMPAELGVSVCSRHNHSSLRRVLLTGAADADLAVKAFNSGSIDLFVPKNSSALADTMVKVLHDQSIKSMQVRGSILADGLDSEKIQLLQEPEVSSALNNILQSLHVVEYATVGEPFGLFCVDLQGRFIWLQLETDKSLDDFASYLQEMNSDASIIQLISDRVSIPNTELTTLFDSVPPSTASLQVISHALGLFTAKFEFLDISKSDLQLAHEVEEY